MKYEVYVFDGLNNVDVEQRVNDLCNAKGLEFVSMGNGYGVFEPSKMNRRLVDKPQAIKDAVEHVLTLIYLEGNVTAFVAVGKVCDEELDKSGALLGRVRDLAAEIKETW